MASKRDELKAIAKEHKERVTVACDEYHPHSALTDCLHGPKESVEICKLWEYIVVLEGRLKKIEELARPHDPL